MKNLCAFLFYKVRFMLYYTSIVEQIKEICFLHIFKRDVTFYFKYVVLTRIYGGIWVYGAKIETNTNGKKNRKPFGETDLFYKIHKLQPILIMKL